ncbi:MAG: gamma-glutamylcyclotransferase family protein [Planctomycetota bacterium]|nr:gamma-glutamylcyclotransferase family protein [Planctomycetota bacterium]
MAQQKKPFNLFVYGTLMNPSVFRAVLGQRFVTRRRDTEDGTLLLARRAVLNGYKKISPDNTYLYAVPARHGRIRGYLIGPLAAECMTALRKYEGRNYSRRTLRVQTSRGDEKAVVFIGNLQQLEHSFGYAFQDTLKQEVLLGNKIDAALLETEREQIHSSDEIGRRAISELRGDTIRDLRRTHFDGGGISDYAIRHALKDTPLRNFSRIAEDPEAKALAPHYLRLVVRQVIFNQIEERIYQDLRYELNRMNLPVRYYERTISSLVSLRILNAASSLTDMLVTDCLKDLCFTKNQLVDFVHWAVSAADAIYDPELARTEMNFINSHTDRGYIPLGAELEFSNIGHQVIRDPDGKTSRDLQYDGFLYFKDFALDVLTWRLGGHIDDHHVKVSDRPRRGFFEVALGSLSIEANLSKPITDDPWLLNQFIHAARQFYDISPHSVHISLQLRSQHRPVKNRTMPLGMLKCLFALAGDLTRGLDGQVQINRLVTDEIVRSDPDTQMLFSEISLRHSSDAEESFPAVTARPGTSRYVQQFKFLRLSPELNYEPLVLGLKGIQLHLRPGSFLMPSQYHSSRRHRKLFEELMQWGANPQQLDEGEIDEFLNHCHEGLMTERRGKPAHGGAYIAWALSQLRTGLDAFNDAVTPKGEPDGGE